MLTGTMSDYKIDPSQPEPLYEQVAAEIRRAIAEGEAGAGNVFRSPKTWRPFSE